MTKQRQAEAIARSMLDRDPYSALASAANARGKVGAHRQVSMTVPEPIPSGEVRTAVVEKDTLKKRVEVYTITIRKDDSEPVGMFKGTVYLTGKRHHIPLPPALENSVS